MNLQIFTFLSFIKIQKVSSFDFFDMLADFSEIEVFLLHVLEQLNKTYHSLIFHIYYNYHSPLFHFLCLIMMKNKNSDPFRRNICLSPNYNQVTPRLLLIKLPFYSIFLKFIFNVYLIHLQM